MAHIFFILRNATTSQISTTYILFMLYIDIASETKRKKVTNSANFSCSLGYCVTPMSTGSVFLSYSTSDFHRSPSANITSGSPISGMDGNSSNSPKLLKYSSLVVVILMHYIWLFWAYFVGAWYYLIFYGQGIVACQWLAWLSSVFKISFYAAMVTCDLFIAQVVSVSDTPS